MKKLGLGVVIALAVMAGAGVAMRVHTGSLWPFGARDEGAHLSPLGQDGTREAKRMPAEPFTFRAVRNGAQVILSGLVSRDDARGALVEEARRAVPNAVFTDETRTSASVPERLENAALFSLRQLAYLPTGVVTIHQGTIAVAGQAPDSGAYNAIAAERQSSPDGFHLDIGALIPPIVRPYTWSATSQDGIVTLTGHVPSEAIRRTVAEAAHRTFSDKRLVESLEVASGVPSALDFEGTVRYALTHLAQLHTGTVQLLDTRLTLRGEVVDRDTLASVAGLQAGLPPGLQMPSVQVTLGKPSPYTFSARREPGRLTLTGYYPDAETRSAIHQLIRQRFFGEQVIDKLRAADGAPQNFLAGVSFGLEHLARLASGEVAVSGTTLRLSGEVLYGQTAEQMAPTIARIPIRGWTGTADVKLHSSEKVDAAQLRSPQP